MDTGKSDSAGKVRALLVYLGLGAGIFAVAAAWIFTGLKLWGN